MRLTCMQSLMEPSRGFVPPASADAFASTAGRLFGFAFTWALGGNLAPAAREGFDAFAREQLQGVVAFPGARAWLPWCCSSSAHAGVLVQRSQLA